MDITVWFGLGLIAGGAVSLLFDDSFMATIRNIIFGLAGSIIGGGIMSSWDSGRLPTIEFYIYSIIFTIVFSFTLIGGSRVSLPTTAANYTPLDQEELEENNKEAVT